MSYNTGAAVDESIRTLILELQGMDNDNAVSVPLTPPKIASPPPSTDPRKRKRTIDMAQSGWILKPPANSPFVTWTEGGYCYKVQSPTNSGIVRLKMEIQHHGTNNPAHRCEVFLDEGDETHRCAMNLAMQIENMWVDRVSGVAKVGGLTQSMQQEDETQGGDNERQKPIFCQCTTNTPPPPPRKRTISSRKRPTTH